MENDVAGRVPEEACGFLAGQRQLAREIFPITNTLHSPLAFHMQPQEQLRAFQSIEAQGLNLLGIYHSHPGGPPDPSEEDLAQAYYPGTVQLIWSLSDEGWGCRGFIYSIDGWQEISLEIISEENLV